MVARDRRLHRQPRPRLRAKRSALPRRHRSRACASLRGVLSLLSAFVVACEVAQTAVHHHQTGEAKVAAGKPHKRLRKNTFTYPVESHGSIAELLCTGPVGVKRSTVDPV